MIGAGLMIIAVTVAGEDMTVVITEVAAEGFVVTIVATGMTAEGVVIGVFGAVIEPVIIRLLPLKF